MIARLLLALQQSKLTQALLQHLSGPDTIVEALGSRQRLLDRLRREVFDLVVVSDVKLPSRITDLAAMMAELPDGPAMVVIADRVDLEQQTRLLAAGCQAVLDAGVSTEALAEVVVSLLEQRRELERRRLVGTRRLSRPRLSDFVSRSATMQVFIGTVERIVDGNVSLLLLGETGVGKERLARAIHNEGPRGTGPFIAVNCAALPETLLESELFGHEEGAFTGAVRSRRGCFELAHGGTVFLDEIGDLPNHLQVKLLSVLQEREFRRVGGERTICVDVRVMAATNRNLEQEVSEGRFRNDLYYRLGVMTLTIPPLRERREDIPDLVHDYIEHLRPRVGREVYGISDGALASMVDYLWPGNVRELINVVERAMLLASEPLIRRDDLPLSISQRGPASGPGGPLLGGQEDLPPAWLERPLSDVRREALGRVERAYLAGLLRLTGGRIGETAQRAGIQPRSLYDKMKQHSLAKEDFR